MKKTTLFSFAILFIGFNLLTATTSGQITTIFEFSQQSTTGAAPIGSLYSDGTYFYGTTQSGGTNSFGTIFKVKHDGTGFVKLFDFSGTDGNEPRASLISDGTYLYGTAKIGGTNNDGTVFKIKTDGTGFSVIIDFVGPTNGRYPYGELYFDGNFLYGTTNQGGTNNRGTMFKVKTDGTGYSALINFNVTNGNAPNGSFYFDGTYFYGTTAGGGPAFKGDLFKVKPDGTGFSTIYQFLGGTDGELPVGDVISDGTYLYGTTNRGGTNNNGTIYKIKPDGTGYLKLLDFAGTSNGSHPAGKLYYDGTYLYGTAVSGGSNNFGVFFKIKPDGTGYTMLADFLGTSNGGNPQSHLIAIGSTLYGTTSIGGSSQLGTIFKHDIILGITSKEAINGYSIFPNPTTNQLTIDTELAISKVTIVDLTGKIIKTQQQQSKLVDVADLPQGIYFIKVTTAKNLITKKFVKQ